LTERSSVLIRAARARAWPVILAAFCLLVVSEAGLAGAPVDPVPMPKPRPGFAPEAAAEPTAAILSPRRSKAPVSSSSRFTPSQQEALYNINDYYNRFATMEGDFIQFGPHGEQSEGVFHISRPGKIRFQYNPPVKLDVISDGRNVSILNTRTMTQDFYPLSKTPLRYLLADNVDLTSENLVDEVREEPDLLAIVIVEKSKLVSGKLTLIFDRQTYELKQWIVTDAQGLNTSVAIYNVTTGKRSDPDLFKINYYLGQ
jgi:outer membrane lipoprotein-sorting protein